MVQKEKYARPPPAETWTVYLVKLRLRGHDAYYAMCEDDVLGPTPLALCDKCGGAWTLADDFDEGCL